MKICWDNLERLTFRNGKWYNGHGTQMEYMDECPVCHEPFLAVKYNKKIHCSHNCTMKANMDQRWGGHENKIRTIQRKQIMEIRKDVGVEGLPDADYSNPSKIVEAKVKPVRKGRPKGHRLSQASKDKIAVGRRGKKATMRSRIKSMLVNKGKLLPNNFANRGDHDGTYFIDKRGYKCIYVGNQSYLREHRWIAEQVLGRPLKAGEVVHHIDGDRHNNDHSNLLICSSPYHTFLHKQQRNRLG